MRDLLQNKLVRISLGVLAGVVLVIVIASFSASSRPKLATELTPKDGPATIANGDDLYTQVGKFSKYLALRNDLTRVAQRVYGDKSVTVLFTVTEVKKGTDSFEVKGYFGTNKRSSLTMTIKDLTNDRMSIDAKDNKGNDISASFDSNSKRNQVIASLPKSTPSYDIDYVVSDSEFFTITVHSLDDSVLTSAKDDLKQMLEDPNFDTNTVSIIYPSYLKGTPQYEPVTTAPDGLPQD